MNNPYTKEYSFLFLNDLNKEAIENKDKDAQRQAIKAKQLTPVSTRFKETFLNAYKERVK
jgi:hypothetical protein